MEPIGIGYQAIENALCMLALRDDFALRALPFFLDAYRGSICQGVAIDCYAMADAMLKARASVGDSVEG